MATAPSDRVTDLRIRAVRARRLADGMTEQDQALLRSHARDLEAEAIRLEGEAETPG